MSDTINNPEVGREIATTADGRDITRGYTGTLLLSMDRVLRERGAGDLRLYEHILSDPQVASCFQQRRLAVKKCEWKVSPASEARVDKKAAEFLRQQLHRAGWDRVTDLMLFGVFYGYSVAEMIYRRDGAQVAIDRIKVRNRRRFRFHEDMSLRLLTPTEMLIGEPALSPYFWHFATGADHDDEPYGMGLAHWCYWPVLFKRNDIKFWMVFLEKFGMPTAKGEYPPTASVAERQKLLAALRAIQQDAGVIIPEGMKIELLEAARSGAADYKSLHDTMDETLAKVILGQTLTSGVGKDGGSRALGDVHNSVRQDLVQADSALVCESFNLGPALWLTQWNYPDAQPPRVYRETEEPEDLSQRAERDVKIRTLGFKPTLHYVTDTYGGEWVESAPPPLDPAAAAAPPADFAEGDAASEVTAGLADLVDAQVQQETDAWVADLRQALEHAESLEAFRDHIVDRYSHLPITILSAAIGDAMSGATAAGRAAVKADVTGS